MSLGHGHTVAFFFETGIANCLRFFLLSVKDEEREARRSRIAQLRVTGALMPRTAGGGRISCDRTYPEQESPVCAREKGKQPQNLRAVGVDRSGDLVRKYRLTYHGNRSHPKAKAKG